MVLGIGTDLADVSRIEHTISQFGDRFLARIYTLRERKYALSKANAAERLAVRFAAKEAGMKAIGTGWSQGVTWHDFEVVNAPSGLPSLRFTGKAAQIADRMGVKRISLSLTHTATLAFAVVILEDSG